MSQLPISILIVIVLLAIFLISSAALRYIVESNFIRTRLIMTSFFCFIVATLTISFWPYALATFPFTFPAALIGITLGYALGVRTEQQKLRMQGLEYYMEHFAHIHISDVTHFNWWSFINFYSVMGGLLLINAVGLSSVIFHGSERWAIFASVVGAFLLGTIVPYLIHLWTVDAQSD